MAKRFHVSMICDAAALYDITAVAAAKKALDVQISPVMGGGNGDDDEAGSGAPSVRTPVRAILYPWMLKQKTFAIQDALRFAEEHGFDKGKGAVYTATLQAM